MDYGTGTACGGTTIFRSLYKDGGFWISKRVMDGIEEKDTADILI